MNFVFDVCANVNPIMGLTSCVVLLTLYCIMLSLRISKLTQSCGVGFQVADALNKSTFKHVGPVTKRNSGRATNPYDAGAKRG